LTWRPGRGRPEFLDARLVVAPAVLALAVTILRLVGELNDWSRVLFRRDAGGLGALVGVIWLAPFVGVHFALRLVRQGHGPTQPRRAIVHALLGVAAFLAFGLVALRLWPPYLVQVAAGAAVAALVVALQLRGWPSLGRLLLLYALASRGPVALVMLFAILGSWGTHYDAFPPGFPIEDPLERWFWGGLVVQMTVWVGNTVLLGAVAGSIAAAPAMKRQVEPPAPRAAAALEGQ
jgi:hypothetical protein